MQEYLEFAKKLAFQAGDIMLEHFQVGVATEKKPEAGNTPVTIADTQINALVVNAVQSEYPEHAVLGEEQSLDKDGAPYVWVCDPIDGTMTYSMGVPINVFSLALVDAKDGKSKVAVVYDPHMKRLYHAVEGGGAFMNGEPIHVNQEVGTLEHSNIGTSATRSKTVNSAALKADIIAGCFRQYSFICTVYEAMLVASGQLEAQVYVGFGAHDVAAAQLIVTEAGGKSTDIFGEAQRHDGEVRGSIMSNGLVHDELVDLAKKNSLIS